MALALFFHISWHDWKFQLLSSFMENEFVFQFPIFFLLLDDFLHFITRISFFVILFHPGIAFLMHLVLFTYLGYGISFDVESLF